MARGSCTFKQSDVTKAARAVVAAGIGVSRIEIGRDGKIVVVTIQQKQENGETEGARGNEWDVPPAVEP
jgi:hypothetical protein